MKLRLGALLLFIVVILLGGCSANSEATRQKLLKSGDEYFAKGQYREAAIMYERAVRANRRDGNAYFRLAKAHMAVGRYPDAARALLRTVELTPENTGAFNRLIEIYLVAMSADPIHHDLYLREVKDVVNLAQQRGKVEPAALFRAQGLVASAEGRAGDAVEYFKKSLDLDPGNSAVHISLAKALWEDDHQEEAISAVRGWLAENPQSADLYDLLYDFLLRKNEESKAEQLILKKCQELDNPGCRLQLAAHYHRTRQPAKRDEVLHQLLSGAGDDLALLESIAGFYERIGNYDAAIGVFRLALDSGGRKNYESYLQLRMAEDMATLGRGADALRIVGKILEKDASNQEAIALRGAIRLYGGDPASVQEGINDLETVIARMPTNPVLRYNLGMAYLSLRDPAKAMTQFQEAAGLLPTYEAPRFQVGKIYLIQGQPALAAQMADEVLKINPRSLRGHLLRANAAIRLQEYNRARASIRTAMAADPRNPEALYLLAALNVSERRFDEAETILRRLYEDSPQDPRGIRGLIGLYVAMDRADKAQSLLDTELKKNPNSRQLLLTSAEVAMGAANWARAIQSYNRLLGEDPDQADIQVRIGVAYYSAGEKNKAEEAWQAALRNQPRNVTAIIRLSMLRSEEGRLDEAQKLLDKVLKIAPDNAVALNNMAFILADSPEMRDTALTLAQRAVNQVQTSTNIRVKDTVRETLAYIYARQHLLDNAITIYSEIVPRNPRVVRWRIRYAQALMRKGDRVEARLQLQEALSSRPSVKEEKQIKGLLSQISA